MTGHPRSLGTKNANPPCTGFGDIDRYTGARGIAGAEQRPSDCFPAACNYPVPSTEAFCARVLEGQS